VDFGIPRKATGGRETGRDQVRRYLCDDVTHAVVQASLDRLVQLTRTDVNGASKVHVGV
jgi:hypothetical protein